MVEIVLQRETNIDIFYKSDLKSNEVMITT